MAFSGMELVLDPEEEVRRIVAWLREGARNLRKSGAVLGISGGIDSSVTLALCVRAFGQDKVIPLLLPEKDSDPESESLARMLASRFGVEPVMECITPILDGFGCYARRDEAMARAIPEYDPARGYKAKIGMAPFLLDEDSLNVFHLTIVTPEGQEKSRRLGPREFSQIVAASNFKQRTRMAMCYYHAELRNFAVIGTPNKNEHDQGFFVKHGDGGADLKPIVHLYKTQVYQLARHLAIPNLILERPPTSDTYSAPSTQEEFFFRMPFETMDLLCCAQDRGVAPEEAAAVLGMEPDQVRRAYIGFQRRRRAAGYLQSQALSLTPCPA